MITYIYNHIYIYIIYIYIFFIIYINNSQITLKSMKSPYFPPPGGLNWKLLTSRARLP